MSTIDSIAEFISSTIMTIVLANNKIHLKRIDMGMKNLDELNKIFKNPVKPYF